MGIDLYFRIHQKSLIVLARQNKLYERINSMAIIESEMISHPQHVLSSQDNSLGHKDSRTDKFCQGEQMLWEKWGLQGNLIINAYDMRYWINLDTNMKS